MIQMLSAFDLPDGSDLSDFRNRYAQFAASLADADLIVSASEIGDRLFDTPMDTDRGDPRRHFTPMTFRDRAQRDAAYSRISGDASAHFSIHTRVADGVFTCWALNDDD